MAKEKDKQGSMGASRSLKDEVDKALGEGRSDFVWIRDDGAVCFGDECVVISRNEKQDLDITVKPDKCGTIAGEAILDHIVRSAGKGVNIKIPPAERS